MLPCEVLVPLLMTCQYTLIVPPVTVAVGVLLPPCFARAISVASTSASTAIASSKASSRVAQRVYS